MHRRSIQIHALPGTAFYFLLILFLVTACGSGNDSFLINPIPPPNSLAVTPELVTISEAQSVQFTAQVPSGTDGGVKWKIVGDPVIGQIGSNSGIFTSPDSIEQGGQIKIQATSLRDNKITATANILVVKSGPITDPSNILITPLQIVLERSGLSALVSDISKKAIFRLDLLTGQLSTLLENVDQVDGLTLDETGSSIFLTKRTSPGSILNFHIADRQVKPVDIQTLLFSPSSILIEPDGQHLVVAEITANRLSRVNLTDGSVEYLATNLDSPAGMVLEAEGATSVVVAERIPGRLSRVRLDSAGDAQSVVEGLNSPTGVAMESGGSTVLVVQQSEGNVARVKINLAGPQAPTASTIVPPPPSEIEVIASQLKLPSGIAVEPGGLTALVTEILPPGIKRIKLANSR